MQGKKLRDGIIVLNLFLLPVLTVHAWAFEGEGIVHPGKGIDTVAVGEPPPANMPCGYNRNNIKIDCDQNKKVKRIYVRSPRYYVAKSRLRVGSSVGEMLRNYDSGETEIVSGKVVIKYPVQGIDFEINKSKEQITAITIYQPKVQSFTKENYEKYKEQFKQKR